MIRMIDQYDEICVLNDARRGKVYAALYDAEGPSGWFFIDFSGRCVKKIKRCDIIRW